MGIFEQLEWIDGTALSLPTEPGLYILRLHLPDDRKITVGRLGTFVFPAGRYFYTGSALGGLRSRVGRHLRTEKSPHWHIDYLRVHASVCGIGIVRTTARQECVLHQEAMAQWNGHIIVPKFGSSDCRCLSHLGREAPAHTR